MNSSQYRETSRDRQQKLKMFEQQLNIKVDITTNSSHFYKCLMFVSLI